MNPTLLRDLFLSLQEQLATRLQTHRGVIKHPGAKGSATEESWRQMLEDYLPARYKVTKASVIDSEGRLSQEIDLVIHDRQYSPFLFHQDGAAYVPAESVYAVLEVKQELSKDTLEYAAAKATSVRALKRTSTIITHAGGTFTPRPIFEIAAGLLCLESTWKPPLGAKLVDLLGGLSVTGRIDLVCALKHGSCEVRYPDGDLPELDLSAHDTALIFFFLRLLKKLQGLGTVPAIDLRQYARVL